ncbi:MAG: TonB-dependent receptor plug domain-containing protein [Alistipes shahii]|uniref:TonB-dependent receptor plug domain-containing protein n=1 Tax=Alistipes shahii TaxID=328814 RepID=UPI00399C8CA7
MTDLPTNYANTALSGMIPGIATSQNSGAPGSDYSWLYVRGLRSWRNSTPLIMLDGHVRDFSILDPNEIDQISVYKDAGALAVLGLRGSNGAIMATTRRGKEGTPCTEIQHADHVPTTHQTAQIPRLARFRPAAQ